MKKIGFVVVAMAVVASIALVGCGSKPAESSSAAIEIAKALETKAEKVDYLVSQAKAFYKSDEFQSSVDIAQYILRYLDSDSQAARELLDMAKAELEGQVRGAVDDAKKKLSGFGN